MKSALILSCLLIVGCTHSLHLAQISDFSPTYTPYAKGTLVKSRAEQFTVMGFVGDTNYVDEAHRLLVAQCSNGNLQGISTQYSTDHGFFSWTNRIDMQGLCVK